MTFHELAAPEDARAYVLIGLGQMRTVRLQPAIARLALEWIQQLASEGHPLPPPALIADVGVIVSGLEHRLRSTTMAESRWSDDQARNYDDVVLSAMYADRNLDRAADALCKFAEKDRPRAVAFIVESVRRRLGIGGVTLNPGALRPFFDMTPEAVVTAAWQTQATETVQDILSAQHQELIGAIRLSDDLVGPEDLFELESGTAVAELGQRLALRQLIVAAARLEEALPAAPPLRRTQRDAPSRLLDDDAYPVGGFAAIANRGSLESLLHSQLAYMEPMQDRPDLFDVKYLRDELLYYSRDENQFFRRRRHYVFEFGSDLITARTKDPHLPFQRIVLTMAAAVAAIRKLSAWMSDEALTFALKFPSGRALQPEKELLEMALRDQIENRLVSSGRSSELGAIAGVWPGNKHGEIRRVRFGKSEDDALFIGFQPSVIPELYGGNVVAGEGSADPADRQFAWDCWTAAVVELIQSLAE